MARFGLIESSAAIAAVIVSMVALNVARQQTALMEIERHASVQPILTLDGYAGHDPDSTNDYIAFMDIENSGVGPALVYYVLEEGEYRYGRFLSDLPPVSFHEFGYPEGEILAPGERHRVFAAIWTADDIAEHGLDEDQIYDALDRMYLTTCYCSIYDACWISDQSTNPRPRSTETCEWTRRVRWDEQPAMLSEVSDTPSNETDGE